mgnify:CR=1 FL=1
MISTIVIAVLAAVILFLPSVFDMSGILGINKDDTDDTADNTEITDVIIICDEKDIFAGTGIVEGVLNDVKIENVSSRDALVDKIENDENVIAGFVVKNATDFEYVVNNSFRSFKSYDQYLNAMEKFGKYLVTPSLKMRAEAVGTKLYDTKAGGQAADFTYPDVDGKMVSLSDFKGKVVLVDVWATWCGPCRQQIPYLKKLEEEMHGTDVVFVGVSVDESKDKQKWLDFIKTEGLKGVQLLAGGWSKITKDYKITGIPRFMVFDKKGNIVSVDAPRPSSPELKKMLENELKK